MSKKTWFTYIELPSIRQYSDDNPLVVLRGSEFDNREEAECFYRRALEQYEFPLQFMQRVSLGEGGDEIWADGERDPFEDSDE